jgi:putative transcriptional regulator
MLDLDIFETKNYLSPKEGRILISEPLSDDAYFGRSVALITEHNESGVVGFVINKKSKFVLSDLIEELKVDFPVYYGGPVQVNSLHFIHTLGKQLEGSIHLFGNLYWGGNFDILKDWIALGLIKKHQIKCFVGYSGWAKQQLEIELKNNFWLISKASEEELLSEDVEPIWKKMVQKMGENYKPWLNVPKDPALN